MTYNVNEKNCEAIRVAYLPFEGDTRQAPKKFPWFFGQLKARQMEPHFLILARWTL